MSSDLPPQPPQVSLTSSLQPASQPGPYCACADEAVDSSDKVALLLGDHQFRDQAILVTRGDYSPLMARMIQNLEAAQVCVDTPAFDSNSLPLLLA